MTGPVLSAGVVVVRRADDGWRVLLLRAYNYWDCPKGLVETGEAPLVSARRETLEETGIDDLDFAWGENYIETPPYGSQHKVARYYLARTSVEKITLPVNSQLGRAEHHEARWFQWEEAEQRVVDRIWQVLRWAQEVMD